MTKTPPAPWSTPYGGLTLQRYPTHDRDLLLAYDGADTHLLTEVAERHPTARSVLVIGDRHGALTTALAGAGDVTMMSDSYLARVAAEQNLARNGRTARIVDAAPSGPFDLVVVRPGKARALLEQQLHAVAGSLPVGTPVIAGEMVKHLDFWVTELLERQVGQTTASLARFKSRLLRSVRDDYTGDEPEWTTYDATLGDVTVTLHNAPGTFASSGIDQGTRLLLEHLPTGLGSALVADVGCGNGVLAIGSALANPQARHLLVDESSVAVASARRSWEAAFGPEGRAAEIVLGDGLVDAEAGSIDVVLCNPPFHTGQTVDEWVGRRLLEQAHTALRAGGELYVVANRHLNHHRYLRHAFAEVEVVAAAPKFSVLRATR